MRPHHVTPNALTPRKKVWTSLATSIPAGGRRVGADSLGVKDFAETPVTRESGRGFLFRVTGTMLVIAGKRIRTSVFTFFILRHLDE